MSLVGTPDYSAPEVLKTGVHQIEANKAKQQQQQVREREKDKKRRSPGRDRDRNKASADGAGSASSNANIGYGKAADWWSLGVMIYEMLCGVPAFRGSDLRHTYQRGTYVRLRLFLFINRCSRCI